MKKFRFFFNLTQEQLAQKIGVDRNTITQYEAQKVVPSFKILRKMVDTFEISFDFFLKEDECLYPRNLKLLKLAKLLDDSAQAQARSHIEITAESLLKNKNNNIDIKQDENSISLIDNFHSNLKTLRNIKKISQMELANLLKVSRSSISMYEYSQVPNIENLINLSNIFNLSIHALTTGEKLIFNFQDKHFEKKMLLADRLLPFEDQKFLIKLMENAVNQPASS